MIAVDYLSHWAKAALVRQITAKNVSKIVYKDICCFFGMPLELLDDQGPGLRDDLFDYLFEKMNIKHNYTTHKEMA